MLLIDLGTSIFAILTSYIIILNFRTREAFVNTVNRNQKAKSKLVDSFTSDCSSTVDDGRQLIIDSQKLSLDPHQHQKSVDHQLVPYNPAEFGYGPGGPMFQPGFGPAGFYPPPSMMMPPAQGYPPPMAYPPFQPTMGGNGGVDFEMFTYRRKSAAHKKKSKRRSRSLEFASMSAQPPFLSPLSNGVMYNPMGYMGPQPMPYFPHQQMPMLPLEDGTAQRDMMTNPENSNMAGMNHPIDPFQSFLHHGNEPMGQVQNFPVLYNNEHMAGQEKSQSNLQINGDEMENEAKIKSAKKDLEKNQSIDLATCCKGFSQILWLLLSIVLIGLILGLVLGLTIV